MTAAKERSTEERLSLLFLLRCMRIYIEYLSHRYLYSTPMCAHVYSGDRAEMENQGLHEEADIYDLSMEDDIMLFSFSSSSFFSFLSFSLSLQYLGDSLESAWREEVESKRRHPPPLSSTLRFSASSPSSLLFPSVSSSSSDAQQRYFTPHALRREEEEERENRVTGGVLRDANRSPLHPSSSSSSSPQPRQEETDRRRERSREPSLTRVLIRFYGSSCLVPAILKVAYDSLLFVGPLMLHTIITFLGECQKSDHPE